MMTCIDPHHSNDRVNRIHGFKVLFFTFISFIVFLLVFYPLLYADPFDNMLAIPFSSDLEGALERSKESGKPVIVVFFAVWCPHCREMRKTTMTNPEVIEVAKAFEWVAIDMDRDILLANSFGVQSIPEFHVLDTNGKLSARIVGKAGPDEFRRDLLRVLDQLKTVEVQKTDEVFTFSQEGPNTQILSSPKGYRARSICFSHVGYGPLDLSSQSPFQALRLGLIPRTPSTLARGQKEVWTRGSWVNIWNPPGAEEFFDYEMLQVNMGFAYGISNTLQAEIAFETRSRFSGEMDGFIQGSHDLFGIDQNGRDNVPRGNFSFQVNPSDGSPGITLTDDDRGTYASYVLVTLQHNVTCGTARMPAFAYAITLRNETSDSDDLEGGSAVDLGLSAALSRRLGDFYVYGTLGYTLFGRDRFQGIELDDDQVTGLVALEWRFSPRSSLLLQYLLTEALANGLGDISHNSNEVTLGYKVEIKEGTVLELGLIENVLTSGNSPDLGFHLGIKLRL